MITYSLSRKSYFHFLFLVIPAIILIGWVTVAEAGMENEPLTEKAFLAELDRLRKDKIYDGPEYDNLLSNGFDFFLGWVCDYHKDMYMNNGGYHPRYLNMLGKNATEEHKQVVLECFKEAPQFIHIIERKNWLSEALPTLLKHIQEPARKIDSYALSAFIKTAGPQDIPVLVAALNKTPRDATKIIEFLSKYKRKSEIKTILEAAWKDTFCANCYDTLALTPVAISYGVSDALRYAVYTLDSPGHLSHYMDGRGSYRSKLHRSVRFHTNYNGDFENLLKWYRQSANSLKYDEDVGKFIAKK